MNSDQLWKLFIDDFSQIHDGVFENWILEKGKYPINDDNKEINELIAVLDQNQKLVLVTMLISARQGGIHDALVTLNDRMACEGLKLIQNEVEMSFQPFGSTMYYDYVCRREGDPWPDEEQT